MKGKGLLDVECTSSLTFSPCWYGQNISCVKAEFARVSGELQVAGVSQQTSHFNYCATQVLNGALTPYSVYYRCSYEMRDSYDKVDARFFGISSLVQHLPYEISISNYIVLSGTHSLQKLVGGGKIHSGGLKNGQTVETNITNNNFATVQYLVKDLLSFGQGLHG